MVFKGIRYSHSRQPINFLTKTFFKIVVQDKIGLLFRNSLYHTFAGYIEISQILSEDMYS